jgi:hypothetical protein
MLHAGLASEFRQALALFLLAFDAGFPGVLDAEDAPGVGEGAPQGGFVIEIALHDLDALAREGDGVIALGLAREAAQAESRAAEGVGDGAALWATAPP